MAEHAHEDSYTHVTPLKIYYSVFATLMVLTAVTVVIAYFDLGEFNTIAAVVIACIKATVVVLYFMHVKYSTRLIKLTVIAGVYWVMILFGLTMGDYMTRALGTFARQINLIQ